MATILRKLPDPELTTTVLTYRRSVPALVLASYLTSCNRLLTTYADAIMLGRLDPYIDEIAVGRALDGGYPLARLTFYERRDAVLRARERFHGEGVDEDERMARVLESWGMDHAGLLEEARLYSDD